MSTTAGREALRAASDFLRGVPGSAGALEIAIGALEHPGKSLDRSARNAQGGGGNREGKPVAKVDGGFIRVSTGHPVVTAFVAHATKRKAHPRVLGRKVIEDWCVAHGQPLEHRRPKKLRAPERVLSADGVLDIWATVALLDCMREMSQRLRMPVATLGIAAMAWHMGLQPGTYKPKNGTVVVLPPRAWPGAPDDDVHVPAWDRTVKFMRNRGAGTTERAIKAEVARTLDPHHERRETPALLAFEAARRSASEMGSPSASVPRPLPTPKEIEDRARRTIPGWKPTKTVEPVPAPASEPKRVIPAVILPPLEKADHVCRYCKTRPMASLKEQSAHGACSTCWTASLDRRIADGLMPRQSVEARVAWLTEQGGVTTRQAAVWSGLARQAETRRVDATEGRRTA